LSGIDRLGGAWASALHDPFPTGFSAPAIDGTAPHLNTPQGSFHVPLSFLRVAASLRESPPETRLIIGFQTETLVRV